MKTIQLVGGGTTVDADNASVTPGIPSDAAPGDLLLVLVSIRNSGAGMPRTPEGWKALVMSSNVAVFGRIMPIGMTAMPAFTFVGGVAGATTIAVPYAIRFTERDMDLVVHASSDQLNASAQNIDVPALTVTADGCAVLRMVWKADDWTAVSNFGTIPFRLGRTTTTGDDASELISSVVQTTATSYGTHTYTVTGGAAAISRGLMLALLPYTSSWISLDDADAPCDLPAAFNAASDAACSAFTAFETDLDSLVNPPAARISATSGVTTNSNLVPFSSVDIDPTGIADLVADPDSVTLLPIGVWITGHAVNVGYSGTDGNTVSMGSSTNSAFSQYCRDSPTSKNPPDGGGAAAVSSLTWSQSVTVPSRLGTEVYITGVGAPTEPTILKATQYMVRLSD